MLKRIIPVIIAIALINTSSAQQFIGLTTHSYSAAHQLPLNPAWVNNARSGPEINLFAVNALGGNNAYTVNMSILSVTGDTATLGKHYNKIDDGKTKKFWANVDLIGPAASFTYKNKYQLGVYTRFRVVANGGNVPQNAFNILSDEKHPQFYNHELKFEKTGAVAHAFGEVGISVGKMIRDDEYIKVGIGANVKYLIGYAAMNVYSNKLSYRRLGDTLVYATGDATLLYTYNVNPSTGSTDASTRAGKGGLGLDIGMFYEYYGNNDPNITVPYKFSIAASITDIGSVGYIGDAGSATYNIISGKTEMSNVELKDEDNNEYVNYLNRLQNIGVITSKTKGEKFRIGLPTAFRLNADWNMGSKIYLSVNTLLNLRGSNGEIYNPGYASYLNFTPRYDLGALKIGLPITLMKYRTLNMGAILYLGPLFIGSSTLLSTVTGQNISNIDVYTGLSWKFSNVKKVRLREYDNGTDPNSGINRFIPNFLKSKKARGIVCPPQRFKNNTYKSYYK